MKRVDINQVLPNTDNPRFIKDYKFEKLVKSIKEFPQMLDLRPIVVNKEMVVLGGNMRLKACVEAGIKEVPIIFADSLTPEQEREFIIKDNSSFGEWDWDILGNEWDTENLQDWGIDIPDEWTLDPEQLGEDFALADGDKEPFQQMTFHLADEQSEQVKNAIDDIKKLEEFKYVETFANENSNGNALYLIIMQWAEQRK
tara:strand:+ start:9637 stop:10233 length:597 start_codon:yes stop_codon:yes gene_type:complete